MMGRTVGSLLRISGPHRIVLSFVVAVVYSFHLSGGSGLAAGGRLGVGLAAVVVLLLVVALGAFRLGLAAVGGGASVALVVALGLSGSWTAVAIASVALAGEVVYFILFPAVVRRCPVEVLFTGVEGAIVPAIGFVLVAGGWSVPWDLLSVTLPLALSLSVAGSLREDSRRPSTLVDLPGLVTPPAASFVALIAGSGAIAVTLGGGGLEPRPELALLASAVAVICAFFGWIALVERRPEWRARRVAALVTSSAVTLSIGLVVVMLFA